MEISITLKSLDDGEALPRWCIDDLLHKDSSTFNDFQLPLMSEGEIIDYPGNNFSPLAGCDTTHKSPTLFS